MSLDSIFTNGEKPFDNYNVTLGNLTSSVFDLRQSIGYAVQVAWSGVTGSGATLVVEIGNDGVNYQELQTYTLSTSTGNNILNVERAMYQWVRLRFVAGSISAGLLNCTMSIKKG